MFKIIFNFHKRIICKNRGHDLRMDNGFFGMFAPKYTWYCDRCGKRSKGDFDSLERNFPREFKKKESK